MKHSVRVWDNFQYGEESETYEAGTFDSYDEAVEAAKAIVLKWLRQEVKRKMTAAQLYDHYTDYGPDPSVHPEKAGAHFSAWDYAEAMCREICRR